ncbi:MAG: hypothetical protein Q8M94_09095 [Ignavibacteria bacterium]|nr:hypothetical protein [Ignavibacteria bacterium]
MKLIAKRRCPTTIVMVVTAISKINNAFIVVGYCAKGKNRRSRASFVIGNVTPYGEAKILKPIRLLIIKMANVVNANYFVALCNTKNG